VKIKLIIIISFVSNIFFAQDVTTKLVVKKTDTTYIKDISDKFIVKINVDSRIDSYNINYNDGSTINLVPNVKDNYSVSLDYKFLGFSVGLPKKWFENEEENRLKGKTSEINLNFNFFFNKWLQTVHYNSTKGYYVENTSSFVDGWQPNDAYIQFPDLKIKVYGGSTSYIFNGNKFSYRSFLQQTQIQRKSAGSFIPTLQYDYFYRTNTNNQSTLDYNKTLSLSLAVGYQYNLVVLKNLNLSGGLFQGFGFEHSKSNDSSTSEIIKEWNTKTNTNINLNLNYQLRNFFCGIQLSSINTFVKENDDSNINNSLNYSKFYLGYRFNAPKIIKTPINWIEKKIF
jgi:hypothetical protein